MTCTPNHILIELGETRREEGRIILAGKTVDDLMREGTERIVRLEAINQELLEALTILVDIVQKADNPEQLAGNMNTGAFDLARAAIKAASSPSKAPGTKDSE